MDNKFKDMTAIALYLVQIKGRSNWGWQSPLTTNQGNDVYTISPSAAGDVVVNVQRDILSANSWDSKNSILEAKQYDLQTTIKCTIQQRDSYATNNVDALADALTEQLIEIEAELEAVTKQLEEMPDRPASSSERYVYPEDVEQFYAEWVEAHKEPKVEAPKPVVQKPAPKPAAKKGK